MGFFKDFCMNCCFWIQAIGVVFFGIMMILIKMDNYYLVSMSPEHKKNNLLTLALAALVFLDDVLIKKIGKFIYGSIYFLQNLFKKSPRIPSSAKY